MRQLAHSLFFHTDIPQRLKVYLLGAEANVKATSWSDALVPNSKEIVAFTFTFVQCKPILNDTLTQLYYQKGE